MATVSERVKKIIANQLGLVENDIRPDSRFTEDLNADSLDMVELTMAMEEEFSTPERAVSIPDEVAESIKTVQDAIDYIRNLGSPDKQNNLSCGQADSSGIVSAAPAKKHSLIDKLFGKNRGR
jgi:acyl carrier protein